MDDLRREISSASAQDNRILDRMQQAVSQTLSSLEEQQANDADVYEDNTVHVYIQKQKRGLLALVNMLRAASA